MHFEKKRGEKQYASGSGLKYKFCCSKKDIELDL